MDMSETIHCDLLVVGAGPAGLFATDYAGMRGLGVALVDSLGHLGRRPTHEPRGLGERTRLVRPAPGSAHLRVCRVGRLRLGLSRGVGTVEAVGTIRT